MFVVELSSFYLLGMKVQHRAVILFSLVCILGWIFESRENWDWALSDRRNPLNIYLVKWGWGWTFYSVGAFLLISAYIMEGTLLSLSTVYSLVHLGVGTLVWYVFVGLLFPHVEDKTGVCQASKYLTRSDCKRSGFWWSGFDSSGHSFLLLWNILFIMEQVQIFKRIQLYSDHQDLVSSSGDARPAHIKSEIQNISDRVKVWLPLLKFQLVFLSLLTLVWEIMLLSTVVHFHSLAEKVVGSSCALIMWFIIYRIVGEATPTNELVMRINCSTKSLAYKNK